MSNAHFSKRISQRIATLIASILIYQTLATPLAQSAVIAPPAHTNTSAPLTNFKNASGPIGTKNFKEPFRLPASVGTLAESYAPNTAGRMIYHFQDVHNHVAAQTNLSEMVSLLEMNARQQGKNLVVAVEGVSGAVNSDVIARMPNQKNKEDVGAALLRGGYLMGEEYAAITSAPGRIKLVGIETDSFYQRNLKARADSRAARLNILSTIQSTRSQLEKLKRHNFSVLLTTLEEKRLAVEAGSVSLTDYATFLANTNPTVVAAYPQLARLVQLNQLEAAIDFKAVEKESQLLVTELTLSKSNEQVEKMMQDAESMKNGQLSALSYYSGLLQQTSKAYPETARYVAYLRLSDAIDADRLFDEVTQAEEQVAHKLIRHPLAQQLYDYLRWTERQEKFFSLNLIPQEWTRERSNTADSVEARLVAIRSFIEEQQSALGYRFPQAELNLSNLEQAVNGARTFYEAAGNRNSEMMSNLQRVLQQNPASQSVVVFIAGGFHTPEMTRQLRAKGLAYEVFRPQLETEVLMSTDLNVAPRKVDYLRPVEALGTEAGVNAIAAAVEQPGQVEVAAGLLVPGPDGGAGNGGGKILTPVLTAEQEANVEAAAKAYGVGGEADKAYMGQMLTQAVTPGDKVLKIKLPGVEGANFEAGAQMSAARRTSELGLTDFDVVVKASAANPNRKRNLASANLVISGMDAGLGENFGRVEYLKWLRDQGVTPTDKMGAKATDLRVSVVAKDGKTHELSIAEIKILQAIRLAELGDIGQVTVQPLVSDESRPSYERLLDQTYFFDAIDSAVVNKRTYRQVLTASDGKLALADFVVQQKLPALKLETLDFPEVAGGYSQAGGHGQFGFTFFFEALRKAKANLFDASHNYIRVFMNSDNPNSRADESIIDSMIANNHVIYMLVTPAEPIDKKGGKLGARTVDVDGKSVAVTDMMEVKQAKTAGQEQAFYAMGQQGGLGEAGAQAFNTNILYINEKLLGQILNELATVLGNGNDVEGKTLLAQAFSATRIKPEEGKPKVVNGQNYLPLDGAIGSVLLNLNAFFLTSTNPQVRAILESRGIDRILHLINVPRVPFFTPNKVPTDHYLFNFSTRYSFDPATLALVDHNLGAPQPELVLDSKVAGYYSDLKGLVDHLGSKLDARDLKSLKITGTVSLPNATLKGDVQIVSASESEIKLNDVAGLPRTIDGRLSLENVKISIDAQGQAAVTAIAALPQSISAVGALVASFLVQILGVGLLAGVTGFDSTTLSYIAIAVPTVFLSASFGVIAFFLKENSHGWYPSFEGEAIPLSKVEGTKFASKEYRQLQQFAETVGAADVKLREGVIANVAVEPNGQKVLEVGAIVLSNPVLRKLVLSHEYVHFTRLQLPFGNNRVVQFINELIAYPVGLIVFALPSSWFYGNNSRGQNDFASSALDSTVGQVGDNQRRFLDALGKIIFQKNAGTSIASPSFVAIDVDSLDQDALAGDEAELMVGLLVTLSEKASGSVQPASNVVFYSQEASSLAIERLRGLMNNNASKLRGLTVGFVTQANNGDIKNIFERGGISASNYNEQNAYVLSTSNANVKGAQVVQILGVPHLALATFAYSHYKDGNGVLSSLVGLFEKFFPQLEMAGHLTSVIANELISSIQA